MKIGIDYVGVTTPFYCHDGSGKLLLHKRSDKCRDEHNRWDPGSGSLEYGLSVNENILKEVKEEYGCNGEVQEILPAIDIFRENNGIQTHWIAIPGIVKADASEVTINEPEKMTEIGWFTLDTLPGPLHSAYLEHQAFLESYIKKYL